MRNCTASKNMYTISYCISTVYSNAQQKQTHTASYMHIKARSTRTFNVIALHLANNNVQYMHSAVHKHLRTQFVKLANCFKQANNN